MIADQSDHSLSMPSAIIFTRMRHVPLFLKVWNTFEFVARYNETLWKAGRYFQIAQSTDKYWIRGVEEIGRKQGLKIYAEMQKDRS